MENWIPHLWRAINSLVHQNSPTHATQQKAQRNSDGWLCIIAPLHLTIETMINTIWNTDQKGNPNYAKIKLCLENVMSGTGRRWYLSSTTKTYSIHLPTLSPLTGGLPVLLSTIAPDKSIAGTRLRLHLDIPTEQKCPMSLATMGHYRQPRRHVRVRTLAYLAPQLHKRLPGQGNWKYRL